MAAVAKLAIVTGAGGFIATQLIKILLEAGYRVRGTVRNTDAAKNAHLLALPGAGEGLTLHKADLLDGPEVFKPIVAGSDVVFHTASPFFTYAKATELGEEFFVKPAVDGTLNVLNACQEAGIKSVVVTSSTAAVGGPRPAGHVYTEADWNDPDSLRSRKIWYVLSKTIAEQAAWDYVKSLGAACTFRLATMNPCMVAVSDELAGWLAGWLVGGKWGHWRWLCVACSVAVACASAPPLPPNAAGPHAPAFPQRLVRGRPLIPQRQQDEGRRRWVPMRRVAEKG